MGNLDKGTKLALAVAILWIAGLCYFVAFLSGKVPSLTQGTDASGNPQGPADLSSLVIRLSSNVQALSGQSQPATSPGSSTPGPVNA